VVEILLSDEGSAGWTNLDSRDTECERFVEEPAVKRPKLDVGLARSQDMRGRILVDSRGGA
jgi:hypothetical protein